ncbi:MAG TPA: hypothetical protein DEB39_13995 [Planctomycetaceae bacterium]|nr:hypothetical protein [Planctomycetaceae bacterium]
MVFGLKIEREENRQLRRPAKRFTKARNDSSSNMSAIHPWKQNLFWQILRIKLVNCGIRPNPDECEKF